MLTQINNNIHNYSFEVVDNLCTGRHQAVAKVSDGDRGFSPLLRFIYAVSASYSTRSQLCSAPCCQLQLATGVRIA